MEDSRADAPRLVAWCREHIPPRAMMILLAALVGIGAGVGAVVLKWLVTLFGYLLKMHLEPDKANFRFLIFPLAGILLTSIYQRYITKNDCSGGTAIMKRHLASGNYDFPGNTIWNSILGCSFTIGFGASAGTEGPVAYSGAVIGGKLGRWFGLTPNWVRMLIGIGAGAGIAGIFKAPLGGALFTLEVLRMEMESIPVVALLLACLLASGTAQAFSDFSYDMPIGMMPQFDVSSLGWVAILALICGLYSVYYNLSKNKTARLFQSIDDPWSKNIIAGAALSLPLFFLPGLFGEGTPLMAGAVNGETLSMLAYGPFANLKSTFLTTVVVIVAMLLVKGALVAAAYYGGGVSGDFMPTLFAGCLLGHLFALTCNEFLGTHLQPWYFSLVGMGATMAGILQAPLMALFIAAETTGSFRYIPAYIVAVLISFGVAAFFTHGSSATPDGDETAAGPFATMPPLWTQEKGGDTESQNPGK